MKIGISGPAGVGKTALTQKLRSNSWMKKQGYTLAPSPAGDHLTDDLQDHELLSAQSFIFNDHIKNIIFQDGNVIADTTVIDSLVELLKLSREDKCPSSTFNAYINNCIQSISRYDLIFVVPGDDPDEYAEYEDILTLVSDPRQNIIVLDPLTSNRYEDIIVIDIKTRYEKEIKANEENSNQWLTEHGQDYLSKAPTDSPRV